MNDKRSFIIFRRGDDTLYYLADIVKEEDLKDCKKVIWTTDQREALEFLNEDEAEEFICDYSDSLDRKEVDITTSLSDQPTQFTLSI